MVDMDCGRDIDKAAEAWELLRGGDVEGAAGLVGRWQEPEDDDLTGVPAPDVCLARGGNGGGAHARRTDAREAGKRLRARTEYCENVHLFSFL